MNDNKNTSLYGFGRRNVAQSEPSTTQTEQTDPKTHTILRIAEDLIVKIDRELAQRLGIDDGDIVSQIEDGTGIIKLIFKDTKNRVISNHHEANNQDYGA